MDRRVVTIAGAGSLVLLAATAWAGGKNLQHYPREMSMEDLKAEMKVLKSSLGVSCERRNRSRHARRASWAIHGRRASGSRRRWISV